MTSPSPEVKPLPCPACGSSTAQRAIASPLWQIVCDMRDGGCGLSSRLADTREEAVRYWNRRRELESRVSPGVAPAQMPFGHGCGEPTCSGLHDHSGAGKPSSAPEEATKDWQELDGEVLDDRFFKGVGMPDATTEDDGDMMMIRCSSDEYGAMIEWYFTHTHILASRSSGEDQSATTDEIVALKRRAEAAEEDWQIAETEVASLKQQVIDSALRAERLEADRTALIEGKVWKANTYEPSTEGWRHSTKVKDGPSPLYATADEALAAYRASLSSQPAPQENIE